MLCVLGIDETLKKVRRSSLSELGTFACVQIERKSRITDCSEKWNEYSDDESDFEGENGPDEFDVSTGNSSEDEIELLLSSSSGNTSKFKGVRILMKFIIGKRIHIFVLKLMEVTNLCISRPRVGCLPTANLRFQPTDFNVFNIR